ELSTAENSDLTGGGEGARPVMIGDPMLPRGERTPDRWSDTSVFARPAGRGEYVNEGRAVIQMPGIRNWNLSLFKNVPFGRRNVQFRVEASNALNTLQFRNVNRGARFDPAGGQTDANFGKAECDRNPRSMQLSLRFCSRPAA